MGCMQVNFMDSYLKPQYVNWAVNVNDNKDNGRWMYLVITPQTIHELYCEKVLPSQDDNILDDFMSPFHS